MWYVYLRNPRRFPEFAAPWSVATNLLSASIVASELYRHHRIKPHITQTALFLNTRHVPR